MATTIEKDTKEITFVGSPQFIAVADDGNAAAAAVNYFIDIRAWTGLKASIPAAANYELFLPAETVSGILTKTSFEISKFVKEFIDSDNYIASTGTIYNGDGAVWYEYRVSADNGAGAITSPVRLALDGYGHYEEGTNPGTTVADENFKVFGNHSTKLVYNNSDSYLIPIYVGNGSLNKDLITDTQVIELDTELGFTLGSLESSEQIAYINLNSTTMGADWVEGATFNYGVGSVPATSFIKGISFDGVGTYMDLGIVPLLNSADSYVNMKFKAFNWASGQRPFGYNVSTPNGFEMYRGATAENYRLQANETIITPSVYPTPDNYQEMNIVVTNWASKELAVLVDGNDILTDALFTEREESSIPFYLGARNNNGMPLNFAAVIFTEFESFNGTTTKLFNDANDWNGATNHGGSPVISFDDGATWSSQDSVNYYSALVQCKKGNPMSLKYMNSFGVVDEFPLNGKDEETITVERTRYRNNTLNDSFNYSITEHVNKIFFVNGSKIINVSTGWTYEASDNMITELMISKTIWLELNGVTYPVTINDTNKKIFNRTWGSEIGYDFVLEVATPLINNMG